MSIATCLKAMEQYLLSNSSMSFLNKTSEENNSTGRNSQNVIEHLCFLFLSGEMDRSLKECVLWCVMAIISLALNIFACCFFWCEHGIGHVYKFLVVNMFACNVSIGFLAQLLLGTLYCKDVCVLRAIVTVGVIVTNHFSLMSLALLSFRQYFIAYKLSRYVVPEQNYDGMHIYSVFIVWIYCGSIAIAVLISPRSYMPISLFVIISFLLFGCLLLTAIKLRKVRRNVIGMQSHEQNMNMESLARQINEVSRTVLVLMVCAVLSWLPACITVLLFRSGVIVLNRQVHILMKISVHVLSLNPVLDFICFLVKTPRLRRSFVKTFVSP